MLIRFLLPGRVTLRADTREDLVFGLGFRHRWKKLDFNCDIAAETHSRKTVKYPSGSKDLGAARMRVTIQDRPGETNLADLVAAKPPTALAELIIDVANRCARAIRYRGYVSTMPVLTAQETPDRTFQQIRVERSDDGVDWSEVSPGDPIFDHLRAGYDERRMLDVDRLHWVTLSITLGSSHIPPEDEFVVNALDHLRQRNYRFTILEIVIGLEILLTHVLDQYLFFQTMMPRKHRKEFLSPQLSLDQRLKGLLHLMLSNEELSRFSLKKVLKVVNWRNTIVHGTETREGEPYDLPRELMQKSADDRHAVVVEHCAEVERLMRVLSALEHQLGSADGRGIMPRKLVELDEDLKPIREKAKRPPTRAKTKRRKA